MELADLSKIFLEARRLCGSEAFVVVGSLAALGLPDDQPAPATMVRSVDVDCYTLADPDRIFELAQALGQGSAFEAAHGYFLDPVSPNLPTLPDDWKSRLVRRTLEGPIEVYFLDLHDAAVSKYARGDPRDREWIRAGLANGLLSDERLSTRMTLTTFLDQDERGRARNALTEDRRWLDRRHPPAKPA